MITQIVIQRLNENDYQTTGKAEVYTYEKVYDCFTLELPWKENKKNISRIPAGHYKAVVHDSPKFGMCLWIQDVPDRSEILIHKGNYHKDTLGCILVGQDLFDIDGDGNKDVTSSAKTMKELLNAVGGAIYVNIFDPSQ